MCKYTSPMDPFRVRVFGQRKTQKNTFWHLDETVDVIKTFQQDLPNGSGEREFVRKISRKYCVDGFRNPAFSTWGTKKHLICLGLGGLFYLHHSCLEGHPRTRKYLEIHPHVFRHEWPFGLGINLEGE